MRTLGLLVIAAITLLSVSACNRSNPAFVAGDRCAPAASTTDPVVCGAGTTCDPTVGVCICPATSALCGSACVDLRADGANCGACGLSCPSAETCSSGRCSGGGCPTGAVDCSGTCIDPTKNPQACGGCPAQGGRVCGAGEACVASVCTKSPCPFGATKCAGACVDTSSSTANCGACGAACAGGQVCSAGSCVSSCPAGGTLCGGNCVDLKHDATNCGSCGTTCSTDQLCAAEGGQIKCRDYRFAGCLSCPCTSCGDRSCCAVPASTGAYSVLCVEDNCPLP